MEGGGIKSVFGISTVVGFALVAMMGCGDSGNNKSGQDSIFGSVGLNVQIAPGSGLTLTPVAYDIVGPAQYTGSITAPAKSTTISGRIGNITPGTYSVTLTGHTNEDASITCSGTAANVAVQAGKAALANVSLLCTGHPLADAGMLDISATASLSPACPTFLNDTASALEIPADGTTSVTLTGTASLSSAAATFTWSAPSGTIAPGTGSPVTFTCAPSTNTTVVPVTLSISNGASGCMPANDVVNVTCTGVAPASCIVYVASPGVDTNDGSTWEEALANVQPALDNAASKVSSGTCSSVEVWVAAGTYKPTYQTDLSDARTATFQLATNVVLYGGFAGTESARSARDFAANVTTLSGDIGAANDSSDNSYHVVTGVTGATIDGFTITEGNANGYDPTLYFGGGMYNYGASPTVANCTFSSNSAYQGGGMYNNSSSPTVFNCTFRGNSVTGDESSWAVGGAMYNVNSSPTVTNCTFAGNSGVIGGGAMYNESSSPTVTNCTFASNGAERGGGIFNVVSSPTVSNCTFVSNSGTFGGGMSNERSLPTVTNCSFSGNGGLYGGGMHNDGSSPTVSNCTFSSNTSGYGGGMSNISSSPTVSNCTFAGNTAAYYGGGMESEASSSPPVLTPHICDSRDSSILQTQMAPL